MDMNDYQAIAGMTSVYPDLYIGIGEIGPEEAAPYLYPTLGLVGEAGELANKVKKILRDRNGRIDGDARHEIALELGDVLWYVADLAGAIGYSLSSIAEMNEAKLRARAANNSLHGSGDNR